VFRTQILEGNVNDLTDATTAFDSEKFSDIGECTPRPNVAREYFKGVVLTEVAKPSLRVLDSGPNRYRRRIDTCPSQRN
jgi:hypothetical protein